MKNYLLLLTLLLGAGVAHAQSDDYPDFTPTTIYEGRPVHGWLEHRGDIDRFGFTGTGDFKVSHSGAGRCRVYRITPANGESLVGYCSDTSYSLHSPIGGTWWVVRVDSDRGSYRISVERTTTRSGPRRPSTPSRPTSSGIDVLDRAGDLYRTNRVSCLGNDVLVGLHWGRRQGICLDLGAEYSIVGKSRDTNTQVFSQPSSHGCPTDMFIQRVDGIHDYQCVRLERRGAPVRWGSLARDGRGRGNDGTQSGSQGLGGTSSHVCPSGRALISWHEKDNELGCSSLHAPSSTTGTTRKGFLNFRPRILVR